MRLITWFEFRDAWCIRKFAQIFTLVKLAFQNLRPEFMSAFSTSPTPELRKSEKIGFYNILRLLFRRPAEPIRRLGNSEKMLIRLHRFPAKAVHWMWTLYKRDIVPNTGSPSASPLLSLIFGMPGISLYSNGEGNAPQTVAGRNAKMVKR